MKNYIDDGVRDEIVAKDEKQLAYFKGELHALKEVLRYGIDKELTDIEKQILDKEGEEALQRYQGNI